ncbi:MAG: N(4)-(beta-N-acetylglucosaminyl)-L-asparaginase [Acidobacteria bacterium]|nr:N(4)-(beta-N-acetylglucosaminyl)-L-asparaginase [Acidobacteriota bacterium]MCZ6832674.1 N(4)-(beta-N-acetylglucosaminyl)-L-asparaginase [Acidobacteriota bacterium]
MGLKRRDFVKAGLAAGATALAGSGAAKATPQPAPARPAPGGEPVRPVAISSANGLAAVERAMERLRAGEDTLDAAIAGVNIVEDDPDDITVGYGGLPNERGVVQLDSSVMHGPSRNAGAVASLENIRNPSRVAQVVMKRTDHVMLVGPGALEFARLHGFKEESLLTEKSRKIFLYWKETLSGKDDWFTSPEELEDPDLKKYIRTYGTINLNVVNTAGDLSGVTTTSGLFFKIPGRVGDSPIIGAGLYVDNDTGACGATGRGEAVILTCGSHSVVTRMAGGESPEQACLGALQKIADWSQAPALLDGDGRPNFNVKFYAVNKRGEYGSAAIWSNSRYAVHDGSEAQLKDCAYLFKRA